MAYIFVDDGAPEAEEYDNNYVWFDERDPDDLHRALEEANRVHRSRQAQGAEAITRHRLNSTVRLCDPTVVGRFSADGIT
jgi:hypothetical protein